MAKHFDDNGNEIRCVYLAMFEQDGYCYVGTANDYDRRIGDHLSMTVIQRSFSISVILALLPNLQCYMTIRA